MYICKANLITNCDPTSHAELSLISEYCRLSNNFSLEGYTLYTSTEPCVMCAGAIKWEDI
ncbi:deaminase [Clostridium tagluense]|uniref:deaminase n=1 Tax=Clostridium tagluense TaxID=360422 RepID=UPI001C0DAB24|nr:nucleoside deaminase [Clostridium tagluense]